MYENGTILRLLVSKLKSALIEGPDLWRVGFSYGVLFAIRYLSGLVEICDTYCDHSGVYFILRNLDKTKTLFYTGVLKGTKIDSAKVTQQPILVELPLPSNLPVFDGPYICQ